MVHINSRESLGSVEKREDLIKHAKAYAEIGPVGQSALALVDGGAAVVLAVGACAALALARAHAGGEFGGVLRLV